MQKISVAIPTYFSSKYLPVLLKSLNGLINIDEIVISEDSNNQNETKNIKKIINKFISKNKSIDISFYENKDNLGAFDNKFIAISKCKNDIVYQIDSDNIAAKNLDKTLFKILNNFDDDNIYYPSSLKQFFYNYQYYLNSNNNNVNLSLETKIINSLLISDSLNSDKKITIDKNVFWILNCGNFIVSRKNYINTMEVFNRNSTIPLAADALAISYLWLDSDKSIVLFKDFYHYHRKRNDSVSLSLGEESEKSFSYFREKFKSL